MHVHVYNVLHIGHNVSLSFLGRRWGWGAWLRRLVAGLSPRRHGFAPGSAHVAFVVDKVAMVQVFLRVLRFPLSLSFHRGCPYSCITWGWTVGPVQAAVQRHNPSTLTWTRTTRRKGVRMWNWRHWHWLTSMAGFRMVALNNEWPKFTGSITLDF
jgi:hypothetical protein